MKFHFNLTKQTLKIKQGKDFLVIPEEWQFQTQFGGIGFRLESEKPHWINFTITKKKINCFYKTPQGEKIIYYQRVINRSPSGIIQVEFTQWDQIEKKNEKWVQKYPYNA